MNWITLRSFTHSNDAHLLKSKLESEGIKVFLKNEYTAQVANHFAHVNAGVELQVMESDWYRAYELLRELGYMEEKQQSNRFITRLDKATRGIPGIGNKMFAFRLLVLLALLLGLILIPLAFLTTR